MKKNLFHYATILLVFAMCLSCSNDEQVNQEVILDSEFIEFNFAPDDVLLDNSISVTITDQVEISSVDFFVDGIRMETVNSAPYTYNFSDNEYNDGSYALKVIVTLVAGSATEKSTTFKIDKNGPFLTGLNIEENQSFCDIYSLESEVEDSVSNIQKAQLFVDNNLVYEVLNSSQISFDINANNYNAGNSTLKFVLEDAVGNVSEEEFNVEFKNTVIALRYPSNFVRQSTERLIVVLSNENGEFLDSKEYDHQEGIITFCHPEITNADQEFMLTFFEVFDNTLYNVFNYSRLTKNSLGNLITFTERPLVESFASVNINTSNLTLNGLPRAQGTGYSIVTIGSNFEGTLTTNFGQGNLGTNNTFVQIASSINTADNYRWAFIENLQNLSSFEDSDFTTDNINIHNYNFNASPDFRLVRMYGYENETLRAAFSGHNIFSESLITSGTSSSLAYANIFDNYFYSIKGQNYYVEGNGTPPQNVNIPGSSISFGLIGSQVMYQGLPNFEVGKIVIQRQHSGVASPSNPSITLNFIFDGSRNSVAIPKIPEGIFEGNIHTIFNNATFTEVQAVAENYEGYNNFEDYLREVFIHSKPFILTSNKRERIFTSSLSPQILPIWEYPYWERF